MTTVLFVHGLESGPHGAKTRALADAGFTVVAHQMPCGQRRALRDPAVVLAAAGALGAVVALALVGGPLAGGAAGVAVAAALPWARRAIVRRMLARSVAVQRRALASQPVDVVVGSSFGGAVALALVRAGVWTGPTVLLCPAQARVAARAGQPCPSLDGVAAEVARRLVVIHGVPDDVVPIDDSRALVAGTRARLLEVDDDHRLTATATATNLAAWIDAARAG